MPLGATGGDRIEAARQTIHLWFDAGLVEGEVRGLRARTTAGVTNDKSRDSNCRFASQHTVCSAQTGAIAAARRLAER
jgi:hypothetical protein